MVDDLNEIEKLTADLNELLRKLNKNYGIGKKLEDQANKALAAQQGRGKGVGWLKWAVQEGLDPQANLSWPNADCRKSKSSAKRRKRGRRGAKRQSPGKRSKKPAAALRDTEPTFKEVEEGFEQFCESVKPKNMSKELQDQFCFANRAAFQKNWWTSWEK